MTRASVCAVLLLGLAASGSAQVFVAIRTAALSVRQGFQQVNPLQPEGFPGPPERFGDLPPPQDLAQRDRVILLNPVAVEENGSRLHATGGVEMLFRGYRVFANEAEGNRDTQIFVFTGNVLVVGKDATVKGDRVTVNFKTNFFRAQDATAQLKPSLSQGKLLGDVYVSGRDTSGDRFEVNSYMSSATTCDLDAPHYEIRAAHTDFRTGIRVIFRKADIRLFGRSILRVPYLSIPLDQRFYDNLPLIGKSPDEGYFVKFRYGFPLKGENQVYARVEYLSRLGLGLGGDLFYRSRRTDGVLRVYGIAGSAHTFDVSGTHRQEFKWGILSVDTSYQHNDYLVAPNSTLLTNRISLSLPQGLGNSDRISFSQTNNQSSGFKSQFESLGLSDQRQFGKAIRTSLDVNYSSNSSSSSFSTAPASRRLDVRFDALDDLKKATAELEYQRSVPIGQTGQFFGTSDQTPVFTLATDSRRLLGLRGTAFPFRSSFSIGEFSNPGAQGGHIERTEFEASFQRPDQSQRRLRWDTSGGYKQGFYSDNAAQYSLNLASTLTYDLGRDTAINLRYNYLLPFGFTPLAIDRTGRTDFLSTDLSFRPLRTLLIGGQTGYDLLKQQIPMTRWQQLGLRAEYTPRDYIRLRSLATYDTTARSWSNLRLDVAYKPGATFVGFGARYDAQRKTWGNVNAFVDGLKWGRAKFSILMQYDGYLHKFDSRQYSMIYDLHCAEAVFQIIDNPFGFRAGRTVIFFVRLKAFPFDTPFGTGTRGQPIGIGTGRDF